FVNLACVHFNLINVSCANEYHFTTKTVPVGEDVKLTCARQTDVLYRENLFWIRIVSGKKPELLGGTMNFDFDVEIRKSHITAKQEPGSFVLEINGAMESDDGVYYCIKVQNLNLTFLTGTFLSVKALTMKPVQQNRECSGSKPNQTSLILMLFMLMETVLMNV
uniref:Ig-like domain-containing protein n=1 Tax=Oryzias sinensis TaxID=183150 RepID=A0A8C7X1U9_9TELE